jgi:hypothetical protein
MVAADNDPSGFSMGCIVQVLVLLVFGAFCL